MPRSQVPQIRKREIVNHHRKNYKYHSHCIDKKISGGWITEQRPHLPGGSKGQENDSQTVSKFPQKPLSYSKAQRMRNSECLYLRPWRSYVILLYYSSGISLFRIQLCCFSQNKHHQSTLSSINSIDEEHRGEKKPREQKLWTVWRLRCPQAWDATGISVYWWEEDERNSSGKMLALPSETKVCMVFMISGWNHLLCVHMVETLVPAL